MTEKKSIRIPELEDAQLNLIPIMNLFIGLIPFLLLSAAFFHLGSVDVTVPIVSNAGQSDLLEEQNKITLNVRMTNAVFELSASSETLAESVLAKLKRVVPRTARQGGAHEAVSAMYTQLRNAAFEIKGPYELSDTCIILPDKDVRYRDLMSTMDALRVYEYDRGGTLSRVSLFPKVVLSSLVNG